MRKASLSRLPLCLLGVLTITAGIFSASPARATSWKVCNRSSEDIEVAIVYSAGDARNYISKGWWKLRACGGCAVVYNGNLPIRGTFLRGEGAKGAVWEGDNLFCTSESRFEIPNANADEATCRHRGHDMKAFELHVIKSEDFTTTLSNTRPGAVRCID